MSDYSQDTSLKIEEDTSPSASSPAPVKTPEEEIVELLKDEENQKKAFAQALELEKRIGNKWITLSKILLKTGLNKAGALQLIEMLKLFGFMSIKKADRLNSKERDEQLVFRLTLSLENKIAALDSIIEQHYQEIDTLKLQIKVLKEKLLVTT